MIRLRRAACAFAVAAGLVMVGAASPTFASDQPSVAAATPDTSTITLTSIAPATIPTTGDIVLKGTLTNGSGQTWTDLKILAATTYRPATTNAAVQAATADPSSVSLNFSLWSDETTLPDLAPGHSTAFTVTIPRTDLGIQGGAGVYTFGVRPVSNEDHPKTLVGYTLIPLLPTVSPAAHVDVSLVLPLRENPLRTAQGTLADPQAFTADTSSSGRLGRIDEFAKQAGDRPLTWLVDPALLDLATDRVDGTAAYPISTTSSTTTTPAPLPSATPTGTPHPTDTPSSTPTSAPTSTSTPSATPALTADQRERIGVRDWLQETTAILKDSTVFALPYGDPSTSTLVGTGHTNLLDSAITQSQQSMSSLGITATPAVAAPSGAFSEAEWAALPQGETAFVNPSATTSTGVTSNSGNTLVVSASASSGGPGGQTNALQLRQRILSEAALVTGSPTTTNLIIELPATWDPGPTTQIDDFFGPLTQPWLTFTPLPAATSGATQLTQQAPLVTADQQARTDAMTSLKAAITELSSVTTPSAALSAQSTRQLDATMFGLLSPSADAASSAYQSNATATANYLTGLLDDIVIDGTQFVTLSGSSGVITVSLENQLNVPIKVGISQVFSGVRNPVTIDAIDPIGLDPGERSTIRLHINAPRVSVQEVTLTATTPGGAAVGTPFTFTIKSSPIGTVIWAVTIAIVLLVCVLVFRKLERRRHDKQSTTEAS